MNIDVGAADLGLEQVGAGFDGPAPASPTYAGLMSAADKAKLNGIEAGAQADLTALEVLNLLKTVDSSGSGLDADLLDGASADFFRNAGNLNAGTLPAAQFNDTSHGARAGGTTHPVATSSVAGFQAAADKVAHDAAVTKLAGIEAGATADLTAAEVIAMMPLASASIPGFQTAANFTKLNGIEAGATADQTASEVLNLVKTMDGSGSGLDADLLDGQDGSFYRNISSMNAGVLPAALFGDVSHGNRSGGTLHANATASVAGFMTAAQFTKLGSIESGATADQTAAEIDALQRAYVGGGAMAITNVNAATDWNTITAPGFHTTQLNGGANAPAAGNFQLQVLTHLGDRITQIAWPTYANQTSIFVRWGYIGTWSAWKRVPYSDDVAALAGAAFTGAITGTSATFSGILTAQRGIFTHGLGVVMKADAASVSYMQWERTSDSVQRAYLGYGSATSILDLYNAEGILRFGTSGVFVVNISNTAMTVAKPLYVAGNFTASGDFLCSSGIFYGHASYIVLGTNAVGGSVYLRPNGSTSTTGQARVQSDGSLLVGGDIYSSTYGWLHDYFRKKNPTADDIGEYQLSTNGLTPNGNGIAGTWVARGGSSITAVLYQRIG